MKPRIAREATEILVLRIGAYIIDVFVVPDKNSPDVLDLDGLVRWLDNAGERQRGRSAHYQKQPAHYQGYDWPGRPQTVVCSKRQLYMHRQILAAMMPAWAESTNPGITLRFSDRFRALKAAPKFLIKPADAVAFAQVLELFTAAPGRNEDQLSQ